jgi:hypothetical protein
MTNEQPFLPGTLPFGSTYSPDYIDHYEGIGKDLPTQDDLFAFIKRKEFTALQWFFTKPYDLPINYGKVRKLTKEERDQGYHQKLRFVGAVQLDSPINGMPEISEAYLGTMVALHGANTIVVINEKNANPWGASSGFGGQANYGAIYGDGAAAGGLVPTNGKSQTRTFPIYTSKYYAYYEQR